jgi:hypothetical protein
LPQLSAFRQVRGNQRLGRIRPKRCLIVSDWERLVQLAAKGLPEPDDHLMPESITRPEAFDEMMVGVAP